MHFDQRRRRQRLGRKSPSERRTLGRLELDGHSEQILGAHLPPVVKTVGRRQNVGGPGRH